MPHVFPKIRERARRFVRGLKANPNAYDDARQIAAAAGPARLAAEYGMRKGHRRTTIAANFASAAYQGATWGAAYLGALVGFREFEAGRLWD